MLLQYDSAFKPENIIVSEMQVRQDYVDYIGSYWVIYQGSGTIKFIILFAPSNVSPRYDKVQDLESEAAPQAGTLPLLCCDVSHTD